MRDVNRRGIVDFITADPRVQWELDMPVDLIELGSRAYVALCHAEAQCPPREAL